MSATASSQESSKRQRVDNNDKPSAKPLNPFHEAKVQLDEVIPSLPMEIRPFISKKLYDCISELHKCSQKNSTIDRLKDEEVRPKSTQSKFEMQAIDAVRDLPEFTTIKTEVEDIKKEFAKKLTDKVSASAKLERDSYLHEAGKQYLIATLGLAKWLYSYYKQGEQATGSMLIYLLDDIYHRINETGTYFQVKWDSKAVAYTILKMSGNEDEPPHMDKANTQTIKDGFEKKFKATIEKVLIAYKNAVKDKICLVRATKALKQFETDLLAEDVTDAIDRAETPEEKHMKLMVQKEVSTQLKDYGGGGKTSAQTKKKKAKGTTTMKPKAKTKAPPKNQNQNKKGKGRQGGNNNDTKKGSNKPGAKKSNQNTKKKNTSKKK